MAYSQSDLDALNKAIATGAKRVRFGSGESAHETEFRSLAEMLAIKAVIESELSPHRARPIGFAEHTRD